MADFVFNIAKGRVNELVQRVNDSDPTNAVLVAVPFSSTATDATLRDLDTLAAIEADGNTAEAVGGGWARIVLDQDDVTGFAVDDANDRNESDVIDLAFGAITAGNDITDILIAYDPDSTGGADSAIVPLTWHDFIIETDGSTVTAIVNAAGFFRAS